MSDDKRDQRLVKIGYHLLKGFNDFFVRKVRNHAKVQMGN